MMGDDPPFLAVGTEVSAKYKGAFCEAKVRKVVKSIKCKVIFKLGLGSAVVSDEQIRGLLRVGAQVEAKHPEKNQYSEGIISKIQDCSQYTVVFDDGDITTLRRTALCLKSGRHFAESETLDQLPLTHPEHFGTPVVGGRRGRRRQDESTDEEGEEGMEPGRREKSNNSRRNEEREPDIGKIVCVEVSDKKKSKDPWFPGLVVSPTAQDAVPIRVKDEYLVRSFKDGRYYTVPKKEALEFTRELSSKAENGGLKAAVEKAVLYLDRDELPAHWDREVLFGLDDTSSVNESKTGSDIDSSDDETREEKDHFVAQLYKFMDDRGTPINKGPTFNNRDLDLYRLFNIVHKLGGFNRVTNQNAWKSVTQKMIPGAGSSSANLLKQAYKKYLHGFEEFYRKLGCTMNSPRGSKSRSRPGRSLIRDRDKSLLGSSTPKREPDVEMEEPKVEPLDDEVEESVEKEILTPRRRSLPIRLLDDKKKIKDEESDHENESSSGQSGRSQRGTRSRKMEDEPPEVQRGRKRQKSKQEEKNIEEEEKPIHRTKVKEEPVSNGKEEGEKKNKATSKENKPKGRKSEDVKINTEDSKKQNSEEDPNPPPKRRGRKPKALADSEEEDGGRLPLYVDVQIGDKLKVYYGPTQDSKVTYEAKVCEIRNEGVQKLYLVHYTGWNTRYDEWIKRVRIAENLSWSPARKRSKSANAATVKSGTIPCTTRPFPGKRGRTKGQDSSRSATPSSVTSTSSAGQRNASSITGEDQGNKAPPASESRRRSRRVSEISAVSAGSEASSEEDDDGSRPRKSSAKKQIESEETETVEVEELPTEETAVRRRRRKLPVEKESSDAEESQVENKHSSESASDVSTVPTPTRRGRRRAQPVEVPVDTPTEKESINVESVSDKDLTKVSGEPKGKDFDLKKIRSELKMPVDISPTIAASVVHSNIIEAPSIAAPAASAPTETVHSAEVVLKGNEEDIYEFREPEPFEFEVRARRESPFSEDRVGRFPRKQIKDEEEEANNSKKPLPSTNAISMEKIKSPASSPPKMRPTLVTTSAVVTSVVPPVIVAEVIVPPEPMQSVSGVSVPEADTITQVSVAPVTTAHTPNNRSVSPAPPTSPVPVLAPAPVPAIVPLPVIVDPLPSESLVIPKLLTVPASQPPAPASVPAPTAHVMPALAVLAARSIVPLQPASPVLENKEPEVKEVASPNQMEESKVKPVVKRERRKTNKKAISREFIESDDDSQDAVEAPEQIQEPPAQIVEEKPVIKEEIIVPVEEVQNDVAAVESAKEEQTINLRRTSVGSTSRLKTEDDLEESSLLCEETIPGSPVTHTTGPSVDCTESSPAPSTSASVEMPFASAPLPSNPPRTRGLGVTGFGGSRIHRKRGLRETLAMQRPVRGSATSSAVVMDNTPPTTPEGSLSSSSNSPDGEHGGLSPDHESSAKSEREFSENDIEVGSVPAHSHPIHVAPRNVGPRASATLATIHSQPIKRRDEDVTRDDESPVKRRRRGGATDHLSRRGRGYGRSPRRTGSDSEDTGIDYLSSSTMANNTNLTSYQPRSTRYNFCEDLDPELDASQRIAILQDKLKELRQTYMALKAQVALIDRRKKKLKRKEKEEKTSKDCTNS